MPVTCSWATATPADRAKYPEAARHHQRHGADLGRCDAWVCGCGNRPDLEGFHPTDDAPHDEFSVWRCGKCNQLYRDDGKEIRP